MAIDIRQQAITLFQTLGYYALCLIAITPRFGITLITMHTHEWKINRGLNPTEQTFYICLILILIARTEETTSIICPPRHTGSLHA